LKFAELPPLSQPALRFGLFVAATAVWIAWTLSMTARDDVRPTVTTPDSHPATSRDVLLLAIVLVVQNMRPPDPRPQAPTTR